MELLSDSWLAITVAIFLGILTLTIAYFKYAYTFWSRLNVVTLPPTIPFGNYGPLLRQKVSSREQTTYLYNELKKTKKPFGGIYMVTRPILLVIDPDLAKLILVKDSQHFIPLGAHLNGEKDPLIVHLINLKGSNWKNMRTKLSPTFLSGKMQMVFQQLVICSDGLEENLDKHEASNKTLDIKDVMGRLTTDIISSCAFGLECDSLKNSNHEFKKQSTLRETFRFMISIIYPGLFSALGLKKHSKDFKDFFFNLIEETVDYRQKNKVARNDFMPLLIQLKDKGCLDGEEVKDPSAMNLTMKQLSAQAFSFFAVRFETSSTLMSGIMYELATHQDVQNKLRDEVNEVLKRHNEQITYEGIMEMKYMDMVIDEAMRIHSIAPFIPRECLVDYQVPNSDFVIKKGMKIFISSDGFHMDPEYYPNPKKFDPERFNPEEKAKRHPYVFMPFGAGPRSGVGLRFELMQIKVLLSAFLKDHNFTLNLKTQTPIMADPKNDLYSIKGGVWLNPQRINPLVDTTSVSNSL